MHLQPHPYLRLFFVLVSLGEAAASFLENRQDCAASYSQCAPAGASFTAVPVVGPGLKSIYVDLLNSVLGITFRSLPNEYNVVERSAASLCCATGTSCLLLQNYNIPFCYDKFTTNFFFPDNAYGTIDNGDYTGADGSEANLISGQYTLKNGGTGNIYGSASDPSKPNTSTLTLPVPFTGTGIGSAIPASALGAEETYTVAIPGTTIEPTVVPARTTLSPVVVASTVTLEVPIAFTVIPGPSSTVVVSSATTVVPGAVTTVVVSSAATVVIASVTVSIATAESPSVIPGTTISPMTTTITTHIASIAATSTSIGAANFARPASFIQEGAAGVGFLAFVIFGF